MEKNRQTRQAGLSRREAGQTIAEVVIALGVTILVITALVILVLNSLRNAQFGQNQVKATQYAQDALDKIKAIKDRDNSVILTSTSIPSCLNAPPYSTSYPTIPFSALWRCNLTTGPADSPCKTSTSGEHPTLDGCYFWLIETGGVYSLQEPSSSPALDEPLENGFFSREILMTDKTTCSNCDYTLEKIIQVTVKWTDASGQHQSNLQTILTKN